MCSKNAQTQICTCMGMHDLTKYGCGDTVKQDTAVSKRMSTQSTAPPVPGNIQPSEIKVEKAFVGSKGNPLNSYIREKALSLAVSLFLSNSHTT